MRPDQHRLVRRLLRDFERKPGALLALQMSLGKTVISATLIRRLLDSFSVRKVLIVAPLRVAQKTWPDEFGKWQHLKPVKWVSVCGTRAGQKVTPAQRGAALRRFLTDPTMEVLIINRENIVWLYEALGGAANWPFDLMVYDESSRLKAGKKRTGTRRLSEFGVYAKIRKYMLFVILLSGTPAPKGLEDLWGQFFILDLGERLGTTKKAFTDRWFDADYMGWSLTAKPHAEAEILAKVKDVMISLNTSDVMEEIPVVYANRFVDLKRPQRAQYNRLRRELALEEYEIEAVNRGVLTFKLLQYANGSVYRYDESVYPPKREIVHFHQEKLIEMDAVVAETAGDNLLVAYTFKFDLDALRHRYPFARVATEDGVLDEWNEGKVRMLLAHPASIGHGMNIQFGGNQIVWYGLTPSLELYQQFNARLPRPGQAANQVIVTHILARDTFDERLIEVLGVRDANQKRVTEATKWELAR